jgi:hypothetical protein
VETHGGKLNEVSKGGAAGILQVVPSSFRDALTRDGVGVGKKALQSLGKTKAELLDMSNKEIGQYLKNDDEAAALFGIAIYLNKLIHKGNS